MVEYGSTQRPRRFLLAAAAFLLSCVLAPGAALGAEAPSAQTTFIPVTGTIDTLDIRFEVPPGELEVPVTLFLEFPAEMRPDRLRGTGVRVSDEEDRVRPPAVSAAEDGVTFRFSASVPPPGTMLNIRISGLETPAEGGSYPVVAYYGEEDAVERAGEFVIPVPDPNLLQRAFRAMEEVPFLRQFLSPSIIWGALPLLWDGFQVAVAILLVSYFAGIPLGLGVAFMKMSRLRVVRVPATIYVDVIRGTPLLVQLLLVFFGITFVPGWSALMDALGPLATWQWHNVDATQFYRVFIVLSISSSAYMAEIFRAGIQSIHKGQLEAARSLGMTWVQSMAFVIIPQTVRRILPTMMSEFILLFKDTSILFAVGVFEITMQARTIQAAEFNMSPMIAAAGFYLMLTVPLGRFVANLEERLSVAETGRGGKKRGRPGGGVLVGKPVAESTVSTREVGLR
ncbi:MAG TPA: amino acid ABC transporter permease [Coriobacteriia bacterium]|nr:amino acid ABC transporter permease [Coriobacteriia bacterium]